MTALGIISMNHSMSESTEYQDFEKRESADEAKKAWAELARAGKLPKRYGSGCVNLREVKEMIAQFQSNTDAPECQNSMI